MLEVSWGREGTEFTDNGREGDVVREGDEKTFCGCDESGE